MANEFDPYSEDILEVWDPLVQGNPETGEIVTDSSPFDPAYDGLDYRIWGSGWQEEG